MRGTPYGQTPADHLAFAISNPARRYALLYAAKHGCVHARDIQREFTDYDRTTARDLLHVLRDRGLLKPDQRVMDVSGLPRQLTYVLTPTARKAARELLTFLAKLHQEAPQ